MSNLYILNIIINLNFKKKKLNKIRRNEQPRKRLNEKNRHKYIQRVTKTNIQGM